MPICFDFTSPKPKLELFLVPKNYKPSIYNITVQIFFNLYSCWHHNSGLFVLINKARYVSRYGSAAKNPTGENQGDQFAGKSPSTISLSAVYPVKAERYPEQLSYFWVNR